jgi:hypothetical protein
MKDKEELAKELIAIAERDYKPDAFKELCFMNWLGVAAIILENYHIIPHKSVKCYEGYLKIYGDMVYLDKLPDDPSEPIKELPTGLHNAFDLDKKKAILVVEE